MASKETKNKHSYFYSLELEGVNCFKEMQTLDMSDGKGSFSPRTIILGDNGTGKTTLLKVLDRMQPGFKDNDIQQYFPVIWSFTTLLNSKKFLSI